MPKRNLAWILVVAMIALLMWQLPQTIARRDSVYEAFGPLVEVHSEIRRRFVEEVDDEVLADAAVTAGIEAMVDQLDDPYARYLSPEEYDRFERRVRGMVGGIGVEVWPVDNGLEVLSRLAQSPAAAGGILPGEIITHIDGRSMQGVALVAANSLLNGEPGSRIELTVLSNGSDGSTSGSVPRSDRAEDGPARSGETPVPHLGRLVRLRRAEVTVDPIRGWARSPRGDWWFILDAEPTIAYVRLTRFTSDVHRRLDEEIDRLLRRNLGGLILDLRNNPGGSLRSGIEVADRFLKKGLLVRESGRATAPEEWYASHEGTYPNFEMAVLVNGGSASAAEMVAGALRDHERAAIIGEQSYGKGCVQRVIELEHGGGAIELTTAYYYLPSGQCIHRTPEAAAAGQWGVRPTIEVALTNAERERWLLVRREVAREAIPTKLSQLARPGGETVGETSREAVAERLLEADIQLREAVEYLRGRLGTGRRQGTAGGR